VGLRAQLLFIIPGKFQYSDMKRKHNNQKGFTLIEMLTALSIFAVIMTISMGSILGIFEANRKSRSLKTVMTNLNIAMESMSKEIRFGSIYHCGPGGLTPQNCTGGSTVFTFQPNSGEFVTYRLNNQAIERSDESGEIIAVTAPEVVIYDLGFYVLGAGTDNTLQPKVIIRIQGYTGEGTDRTKFSLQTMVSQRELDI
jgi:prepilin-type N-terminal cleavage/methylation domain-containing protein